MVTSLIKIEHIEDAGDLEVLRLHADPSLFLQDCAPIERSKWWFSCGKISRISALETNS